MSSGSNLFKVHAALLTVNLIYGANYIIAKEVMPDYIQPFGFIFVRVTIATALFWALKQFIINELPERKDLARLFICGFFGVALNQLMFFKGLNLTVPINASLIMITTPILVLLISAAILKERLRMTKITGIIAGVIGAFLIVASGSVIKVGEGSTVGDLFILVNATSYALYLVLVKPLMIKYHPVTIISYVFLFGCVFVIPAGFSEFRMIDWSFFPLSIWMAVIFVVVGTTFLAYLLNIFALSKVNPSVVGVYIYLQPLFASTIALSFGKDELDIIKIFASILIFAGVYLVSKPNTKMQTTYVEK